MLNFKSARESFITVLIILLSTFLGLDMALKTNNEFDHQLHSQSKVFDIDPAQQVEPEKSLESEARLRSEFR